MTLYEAEKKFDQFKEIATENLVGWLDLKADDPIVEEAAKKIADAVVSAFGEMENRRQEELERLSKEGLGK